MKNITIGFDAKRVVCNNTGLGNYSRLVIDSLAGEMPEDRFLLYTPVSCDNDRLKSILDKPNVEIITPAGFLGKSFGSLWRVGGGITRQMQSDGVDIYHGLSNELPLDIAGSGIASVVTIHDLIFRRMPEGYARVDRAIYDYKFRKACENATRIIAISECTRRDIMELYNIPAEKIDVVYQGCDSRFSAPVDEAVKGVVKRLYNLPDRYIVSVGTIELRKNQLQAIKALPALPREVSLVIVGGQNRSYYSELVAEISRLGLAARVKFMSGVPSGYLPAIYAMSQFASYTSRYEGFGIPVIEALSTGVPMLAATGSCLEEAGGKGALYVSPDSVDEYVDAARLLLDDENLRCRLIDEGRKHVARFSKSHFVSGLRMVYEKALSQRE